MSERIEKLISEMTLKQKIGQLYQSWFGQENFDEALKLVKEYNIGSFILASSAYAGNDEQKSVDDSFSNKLQKVAMESGAKIPLIFGRDVIHGHKVVYPNLLTMAASFDPPLVQKCYDDVRNEAYNDSIHWTFTPMLDLSRDSRWGRIVESPGEDPYLSGEIGKAVVRGFQTDDVSNNGAMAACLKHYIGYGASEAGKDYHHTEISDFALYNYYLPAFKACVEEGAMTVMSSFNELSGFPASSSKKLLTDILRNQLGFDGFVVSDWASTEATLNQKVARDRAHAAKLSLEAGVDMEMVTRLYLDTLEESVNNGYVNIETINTAVRRILEVKEKLGLLDNPYIEPIPYNIEEHLENALKMAENSMVLLKNDDITLPLSQNAKVYVTGDFTENVDDVVGSWALAYNEDLVKSLKYYLDKDFYNVTYAKDYLSTDFSDAKDCDYIIIAIGESKLLTGEAHSVTKIEIKDEYKQLIKSAKATGKKVIGVLHYGRPIAFDGIEDYFDAILYAWHSGTKSSEAICNLLYGKAVPCAKLPVTMPRVTGQIPLYYNAPLNRMGYSSYCEKRPPNVRAVPYDDCESTPAYPFGYGLSYTTFEISDINAVVNTLSVSDLESGKEFEITLNIKNTGDFDGAEVVQLYTKHLYARRVLPARALKKFQKVYLKKGEEQKITFKLGKESVGYYLEDGSFVIDETEISVFIGNVCTVEDSIKINII